MDHDFKACLLIDSAPDDNQALVPAKKVHRKPAEQRKERYLKIRVTESQWIVLNDAARSEQLTLAEWARVELLASARKKVTSTS